jgi:signal transduction histidine kinase
MTIVLRWPAICLVGLGLGIASRQIVAGDGSFSFASRSWIDQLVLLGAGWSIIAAAAITSTRRIHVQALVALVMISLSWFGAEWDSPRSPSSWILTAGLVLTGVCPALVVWFVLVHASGGRLARSTDRALVALMAGSAIAIGVLPNLFFDPQADGCGSCKANLLAVSDDPDMALRLGRLGLRVGVVAVTITLASGVWRVARSTPAYRRLHGVVLLAEIGYLVVIDWRYAISVDRGYLGTSELEHRLWMIEGVALASIAGAVAFGRIRARQMCHTIAGIVVPIDPSEGSHRLRESFAKSLGDPDLDVVYALEDASLVDIDGLPYVVNADPDRVVTPLLRNRRQVAGLVHRRGSTVDPLVVDEVMATAQLVLQNERLQASLRAHEHELLASRTRIVEAGDAERRRLERNLHDGAQQRLVGLLMAARLARLRTSDDAPSAVGADLDGVIIELQLAITELRRIAHGIHPPVLSDEGLLVALDSLAETAPLELVRMPAQRFPTVVEHAAYRVIAEALHAGPTRVDGEHRGGSLVVDISTPSPPDEFTDLEDRVGAARGTLRMSRPCSDRVELHLEIPCGL